MLLGSLKPVQCKTVSVCLWADSLALYSLIHFFARILCVDAYGSFCSVKLKVA